MRNRDRQSLDRRAHLQKDLLPLLDAAGPSSVSSLARRLGFDTEPRTIVYALQALRAAGKVERGPERVGLVGHRVALWGLRGDPRWSERPVRDPKKARCRDNTLPARIVPIPQKCEPGITPDDLAWQAYYRLPRAARRGFPPPESGRAIAGWDCLDKLYQCGLSEGEGRP